MIDLICDTQDYANNNGLDKTTHLPSLTRIFSLLKQYMGSREPSQRGLIHSV